MLTARLRAERKSTLPTSIKTKTTEKIYDTVKKCIPRWGKTRNSDDTLKMQRQRVDENNVTP